MTEKTTNQKIADLLFEQTYDERMEMARFLSGAAIEWTLEHSVQDIDDDYFATLLGSWAEAAT